MRYLLSTVALGLILLLVACSKDSSSQLNNKTTKKAICEHTPNKNGCVDGRLLHVPSPEWQDQIIYFAMIDRFNDGDPSNNDQGVNVYDPSKESHYSGGDLRGVTQQLDYIQQLGATALWLTPFVANMWWDPIRDYGGYHGYWARDFKAVDEHYGTLDDLKDLSHALHSRDMFLVQDIVVNHTGNYFDYDGNYDASDLTANLIFNTQAVPNSAPTQVPFNKIDIRNPEHRKAAIYNWTPEIQDFNDPNQELTYQTAALDDLNTRTPAVINALKDSYNYWITEVGVDAFRIDTVKYVDKDFYRSFIHGSDGVVAAAKSTGRKNFFTFGEVFNTSLPYRTNGEEKLSQYISKGQDKLLDAAIGFPLYNEINQVFASGAPTHQLAHRLNAHMEHYANPYIVPNFIDNHDVERFMAGGSEEAFILAYTLMMTVPGIPVIYQGDEQGFNQFRKAMFKGGYQSEKDYFDQSSRMYERISSLAKLRLNNPVFTRGTLEVLQSNDIGPGVLVYKREYKESIAFVVLNTASYKTLASGIPMPFQSDSEPEIVYRENTNKELSIRNGQFTQVLEPQSALVIVGKKDTSSNTIKENEANIEFVEFETSYLNQPNAKIRGKVNEAGASLLRVIDGDMSNALSILADEKGEWEFAIPGPDLGEKEHFLEVYWPEKQSVSDRLSYKVISTEPEFLAQVNDTIGDATGLSGRYVLPTDPSFGCQMDIDSVDAKAGGRILELTIRMCEISDLWQPSNGFDHLALTTFFSLPNVEGNKVLPVIGGAFPNDKTWSFAHASFGWGNAVYTTENAGLNSEGKVLSVAPEIKVEKELNEITFTYDAKHLNIETWEDVEIYITTWDKDGGGAYRSLGKEPKMWQFGGAIDGDPKILDTVLLKMQRF